MVQTMRIASEKKRKALPLKINFTVAALKALRVRAGKDRLWAFDTKTLHLAYMLTTSGARSFYWYGRENGRPIRKHLGDGSLSIEQARKLASAQTSAVADGETPHADRRKASEGFTLGELWAWYLEQHAKPKKRSWEKDEERYTNHLSAWAARRLTDISMEDVSRLHTRIGETAPGAANRTIALLRGMYNKARTLNYTGPNPAAGITKFPEQTRERFLQADELPRFFKALKNVSQDMRDFFTLCLLTGARRGNVLTGEWPEVSFDTATWTIPANKFKTNKPMVIPLVPDAVKIFKRRQSERADPSNQYVFAGPGATGHIQEPKRAWAAVCKSAKLDDLRIHDLRRTLGSWQAAAGTSLSIIGKSLGHTQPSTTQIYARLNLEPVRKSVGTAVDAMMAAGKKTSRRKAGA